MTSLPRALRLGAALDDAYRLHGGDVDKAGHPYLGHLLRVASYVADDPDAVIVALLHDAQEDHGDELPAGFIREKYGDRVGDAVDALTHPKDEPYDEYIDRILAAGALACAVKMGDLTDHLVRLDEIDDQVLRARLERKYLPAIRQLADGMRAATC